MEEGGGRVESGMKEKWRWKVEWWSVKKRVNKGMYEVGENGR